MRPLIIALALALGATPAAAQNLKASGGTSGTGVTSGGTGSLGSAGTTPVPPLNPPLSQPRPPVRDKLDRGAAKPGNGDGAPPPDRPDRPFFPFFHGDHDDDRIIVVPAPAPPPPGPPEPETAEPPPPPEPGGPVMMTARGATPPERYTVGEPLSVPFVTLHWRQYGLPEPPAGLIYARVGRDVLLIDPVSRVVRRRLDPAELREDAG